MPFRGHPETTKSFFIELSQRLPILGDDIRVFVFCFHFLVVYILFIAPFILRHKNGAVGPHPTTEIDTQHITYWIVLYVGYETQLTMSIAKSKPPG